MTFPAGSDSYPKRSVFELVLTNIQLHRFLRGVLFVVCQLYRPRNFDLRAQLYSPRPRQCNWQRWIVRAKPSYETSPKEAQKHVHDTKARVRLWRADKKRQAVSRQRQSQCRRQRKKERESAGQFLPRHVVLRLLAKATGETSPVQDSKKPRPMVLHLPPAARRGAMRVFPLGGRGGGGGSSDAWPRC